MIHLISRDYFYKTIGKNVKFLKYPFNFNTLENFICPKYTFYYSIDHIGVFAVSYNTIYVPEIYNIDPGLIIKEQFTTDDWKLKQVNTEITNKQYTINCFKSPRDIKLSSELLRNYDFDKLKITSGDWTLENEITKEILEFSIKIYKDKYNYSTRLLLAYPEKLECPIDYVKCFIKEDLIVSIIRMKLNI